MVTDVPRKFAAEDEAFFAGRKELTEKWPDIPALHIVDNWPLFAGHVNIARFLSIHDLFRQTLHLPGHVCELGCFNGTNLLFLAKLLTIYKPRNLTEVFGFDTFEGLETIEEGKDVERKRIQGKYKGNVELLEDLIHLNGFESWVHLVKGDVQQTVPQFLEERKDVRFSFIYIDMDLYAPTVSAVKALYPKLLKGGIMVFDEYNTALWPGETMAVHEVLGEEVKLRQVPGTRQPTAYLVK
ncbi:macrocin-O-methyltransferase [bacterium]|nr:macrocin-O-methyltransferase [bacterium]